MVSLTKPFRSHYGPGVESASNRNEYQVYFLGCKGGRCVRLTNLPPSCAIVMKSGKLYYLEPSGPVQACNGTALLYCQEGTSTDWRKREAAGDGGVVTRVRTCGICTNNSPCDTTPGSYLLLSLAVPCVWRLGAETLLERVT